MQFRSHNPPSQLSSDALRQTGILVSMKHLICGEKFKDGDGSVIFWAKRKDLT